MRDASNSAFGNRGTTGVDRRRSLRIRSPRRGSVGPSTDRRLRGNPVRCRKAVMPALPPQLSAASRWSDHPPVATGRESREGRTAASTREPGDLPSSHEPSRRAGCPGGRRQPWLPYMAACAARPLGFLARRRSGAAMTIASNLGFPRIGRRRELKSALERFWSGRSGRGRAGRRRRHCGPALEAPGRTWDQPRPVRRFLAV